MRGRAHLIHQASSFHLHYFDHSHKKPRFSALRKLGAHSLNGFSVWAIHQRLLVMNPVGSVCARSSIPHLEWCRQCRQRPIYIVMMLVMRELMHCALPIHIESCMTCLCLLVLVEWLDKVIAVIENNSTSLKTVNIFWKQFNTELWSLRHWQRLPELINFYIQASTFVCHRTFFLFLPVSNWQVCSYTVFSVQHMFISSSSMIMYSFAWW